MEDGLMVTPDRDFINIMNSGKAGDTVQCRLCGVKFQRPFWFFYELCASCFERFDQAKMEGRCGLGPPMESVTTWMEKVKNA